MTRSFWSESLGTACCICLCKMAKGILLYSIDMHFFCLTLSKGCSKELLFQRIISMLFFQTNTSQEEKIYSLFTNEPLWRHHSSLFLLISLCFHKILSLSPYNLSYILNRKRLQHFHTEAYVFACVTMWLAVHYNQ